MIRAQTIEFRATINSAPETTGSTSAGNGWAVLIYDVGANAFDLTVGINNLTNLITASHIHEGAVGVAGPVVTNLGAEAVYQRDGATVTATFTNPDLASETPVSRRSCSCFRPALTRR